MSRALPVFHAFSGCDTTSSFLGVGKRSAWQSWQAYPEVTEAFVSLAKDPFQLLQADSACFRVLERFVVVLYDRTSSLSSVNEARRDLFCHKNQAMERVPPTQDTLLQHTLRVIYQAGIWMTSDRAQQAIVSPQHFGWTKAEHSWLPVWLTLPDVSHACRELIRCSCKGDCSKCKCGRANLDCTPVQVWLYWKIRSID